MFDRRSKLLGRVTLLQDLAVTALAFVVAYYLRDLLARAEFFPGHLHEIYPFGYYIPLMLVFLLVWAVVGYFSRFYRDLEMSNPIQLVLNLLNQLAIVLVFIYAGLYLLRRGDISRTYVLMVGVVNFILLVASRYVSYSGIAWMRHRLGRYHYLLIVGCGSRAREMATLIEESRSMGLRLVGFVNPTSESSKLSDRFGRYEVFPLSAVERVLQDRVIDEVVFAVSMQELARLEPLMSHCANVGVKTRVQLEFLPSPYSRIYLENFRHVPLLSLSTAPESELLLFLKRTVDVVVAAFSLVLLVPALIAIAASIRITSPGDVLFRQTRCGLGGRRFTLYKFRSMVNNAEQLRSVTIHGLHPWDVCCAVSASTNYRSCGIFCAATCRSSARGPRFRMRSKGTSRGSAAACACVRDSPASGYSRDVATLISIAGFNLTLPISTTGRCGSTARSSSARFPS